MNKDCYYIVFTFLKHKELLKCSIVSKMFLELSKSNVYGKDYVKKII